PGQDPVCDCRGGSQTRTTTVDVIAVDSITVPGDEVPGNERMCRGSSFVGADRQPHPVTQHHS
ncbi:MAG: hypothetical protein ACTINW_02710, partial [Brevibacterium aurantiacum]